MLTEAGSNFLPAYSAVPEPSTFVLFGIGAIGLFAWRRRQSA
jgi:hypothetical protein